MARCAQAPRRHEDCGKMPHVTLSTQGGVMRPHLKLRLLSLFLGASLLVQTGICAQPSPTKERGTPVSALSGATLIIPFKEGGSLAIYLDDDNLACIESERILSCQAEWGTEGRTVWVFDPSIQKIANPFMFRMAPDDDRKLHVSFKPFRSWEVDQAFELRRGDALNIAARAPARLPIDQAREGEWGYKQSKQLVLDAARAASHQHVSSPMLSAAATRFMAGRSMSIPVTDGGADLFYFADTGRVCSRIERQEHCNLRWRQAPPRALEIFHLDDAQHEVPFLKFSLVDLDDGVGVYVWREDKVLQATAAQTYTGNVFALGIPRTGHPSGEARTNSAATRPSLDLQDVANQIKGLKAFFSILTGGSSSAHSASSQEADDIEMVCDVCPRETSFGDAIYNSSCNCHVVRRDR
jgi:hypothetical protein